MGLQRRTAKDLRANRITRSGVAEASPSTFRERLIYLNNTHLTRIRIAQTGESQQLC